MNKFYLSLDELVKALNIFASLQKYAIVKKYTKVSMKKLLHKTFLIYDRGKEYIDENRGKKVTISRKTNCFFDANAILVEEKWSYRLRKSDHNHDLLLAGTHPAHRKIARIEDVLDQITNHAKTGALLQQTFIYLRLSRTQKMH